MRLLNKLEQDLCMTILQENGNYIFLQNIILRHVQGATFHTELGPQGEKLAWIEIFTGAQETSEINQDEAKKRYREMMSLLVTAVHLIGLLEKNGYLVLHQEAPTEKKHDFGYRGVGVPVRCDLHDKAIIDSLINYVDRVLITNDEFERFCKEGFIARDEQRYQRQIRNTFIAIAISTISLLISAYTNVRGWLSDGTKIGQQQMSQVDFYLGATNKKLDSIVFLLKMVHRQTRDSLVNPSAFTSNSLKSDTMNNIRLTPLKMHGSRLVNYK
ncbi:hypothetical protein [Chitinophaga filiformis]|uniref:Uncharacterized protein n=1 Tax=Chitinophaga filiformis TaxID=104663 RepID=A0ABY4HW03_CHIFI|nr:hypothetical protein [Chitinophaga filiformis]UPK67953.1 hypothetical protein MYF79_23660 [Chitinophaga filiformis]